MRGVEGMAVGYCEVLDDMGKWVGGAGRLGGGNSWL